MDVPLRLCLSCAFVQMMLRYKAIVVFSSKSEADTINLGQIQVLDVLWHSGSDSQTLRRIVLFNLFVCPHSFMFP